MAVVGIQHGTDDVVYELMTVFNITNTGDSILTRTSSDEDFTNISIQVKAYNKSGLTRNNFGLGLVLLDANGQWVDDLSSVSWESLNNHYGGIPTFSELSFGADLPDGEYYIVPYSISGDAEVWEPCYGADTYRIKAIIEGDTLILKNPVAKLNAIVQTTGKTEVNTPLPMRATITNLGSYFNADICLYVDSMLAGAWNYNAQTGETKDVEMHFMPVSSGKKEIILAFFDSDNKCQVFAETFINVSEAVTDYMLEAEIVIDSLRNGVMNDDHFSARFKVENKGGTDYANSVIAILYKYDETDSLYHSVCYKSAELELAKGASTLLDFTFGGLENKQKYQVTMLYANDGKWIHINNDLRFTTDINYVTKLSGILTLTNSSDDNTLAETTAKIRATINNVGNVDIEHMALCVDIYKYDKESNTYKYLTFKGYYWDIACGGQTTFDVEFDQLEKGAKYAARFSYGEANGNGGYNWTYDLESVIFFSIAGDASFVSGDVNSDGSVDIGDIVMVISVMTGTETDDAIVARADVNSDGAADIGDIVSIIGIMTNQPAGARAYAANNVSQQESNDHVSMKMHGRDVQLSLNNALEYTAFQLLLSLPEGTTVDNVTINSERSSGHVVAVEPTGDGQYLIMGYSLGNKPLKGCGGTLLNIETKGIEPEYAYVDNAVFANTKSETFHLTGGETTGIKGIKNSEFEIGNPVYDLQGRRVRSTEANSSLSTIHSSLKKGIYLVGNRKVLVK